MIFVIAIPTSLASVRYRWLANGTLGGALSSGITQLGTFQVYRIDTTPPSLAEELIVYDVNDVSNFSLAHYGYGQGGGGGGGGATASEIADAVWDEASADHNDMGTMGAKLNAAGALGDPWSVPLPATYAPHSAGAIVARLDINPPEAGITVLPGQPPDLPLCRVMGYFETLDNKPAQGVRIVIELIGETGPVKTDRLISGRKLVCTTDSLGRLFFEGNPWVDVQKNNLIVPAGSQYLITSDRLALNHKVTLTTDLYDLSLLVS